MPSSPATRSSRSCGAQARSRATPLARVGVGVAVRQGEPTPDISTVDAFTHALFAARSIVYNDPATGATSRFARAGLDYQEAARTPS